MSANVTAASSQTEYRDKVGLILGGMPDENDVVPSALIIIMYTALFAPIIFRIRKHTLTFGQLWKPLLFILMRIATFAMRIHLAGRQQWKNDVFITQLIFLRLGPIILTSALITLFAHAMMPYLPSVDAPNFFVKLTLKHFVSLLQLATYFCLGLTIAVSFDVKQAINGDITARAKLHRSKEISIWLLVAINISVYFLTVVPLVLLQQKKYIRHLVVSSAREHTKFMSLLSVCTFLLATSSFKAAQLMSHGLYNTNYMVIVNKKILFYSICCLGEYIACMLLVSAAWARIVPPPDLLEAYCRMRLQQQSLPGQGDGGNGGQQCSAPPNQGPTPPPPSVVIPAPSMMSQVGVAGQGTTFGGLRAPGGVYGDQTNDTIPRKAVVHSITVDKSVQDAQSDQAAEAMLMVPRHHEKGAVALPAEAYVIRDAKREVDNDSPAWSTIPISSAASTGNTPKTHVLLPLASSTTTIVPPPPMEKENNSTDVQTRCNTPLPKRASSATLSTISEVGIGDTRKSSDSINTTTFHPRTASLESLILPPTLLPHHPEPAPLPAAFVGIPMRRQAPSPSSSPAAFTPLSTMKSAEATMSQKPMPTLSEYQTTPPSPSLSHHVRTQCMSTYSLTPIQSRPNLSLDSRMRGAGASITGYSPNVAQANPPLSAQSTHSYWSDDSEEGHREAPADGTSHHLHLSHLHVHRHHRREHRHHHQN